MKKKTNNNYKKLAAYFVIGVIAAVILGVSLAHYRFTQTQLPEFKESLQTDTTLPSF